MKNITKNLMIFSAIFLLPNVSYAQKNAPSCESMGYVSTAAECSSQNKPVLKCPSNAAKLYCGYTITQPKCSDYAMFDTKPTTNAVCTTDTSKGITCYKDCSAPGYILYSDKTVSHERDYTKTPIGIVADPAKRLAISLNTQHLQWASENYIKVERDVPNLPNLTQEQAEKDFNGKSNTLTISKSPNAYLYSANNYCYNYATAGTSKSNWYLPAAAELKILCSTTDDINIGLAKTANPTMPGGWHWSSSESSTYINSGPNNYTTAFYISLGKNSSSTCYLSEVNKFAYANKGAEVRCFIKY